MKKVLAIIGPMVISAIAGVLAKRRAEKNGGHLNLKPHRS